MLPRLIASAPDAFCTSMRYTVSPCSHRPTTLLPRFNALQSPPIGRSPQSVRRTGSTISSHASAGLRVASSNSMLICVLSPYTPAAPDMAVVDLMRGARLKVPVSGEEGWGSKQNPLYNSDR